MIDIEKFICSLLADHPEGVTVRGDIHRALKEQGLEYKDGKIVPIEDKTELKGSMDERIRKSIIGFLITISSLKDGKTVSNKDFDTKAILEWIAWLEKQGNETPCDRCKKSQPSHSCQDITELGRCYLEHEKQGEQNPNPYSGVSFVYNNHTWGMCARDSGVDILCDSKLIKHIEYPQDKTILENLSEQKQEWSEKDENECNHILKLLNLVAEEQETKGYNNLISSVNWLKSIKDRIQSKQSNKPQGKTALEAVKKEKVDNANKVESKFKVGDWVVRTNGESFCNGSKFAQIQSIELDGEMCYLDTGRWLYPSEMRLWTINDAQDGDVLVASDGSIFIFAGVVDCACKYYITLTATNDVKINKEKKGGYWETSRAVHPATKEQCALLFQKMREEGYEWDSESKELIKIE